MNAEKLLESMEEKWRVLMSAYDDNVAKVWSNPDVCKGKFPNLEGLLSGMVVVRGNGFRRQWSLMHRASVMVEIFNVPAQQATFMNMGGVAARLATGRNAAPVRPADPVLSLIHIS